MDFGIALTPSPTSWQTAKRAEELGFAAAWFYDSQLLYMDIFVAMALAAEHTSRIRLGTGVLVPTNRIAPVAANATASLNALAPGRIDLGIGTGFTARNTMGLKRQKLADLEEYWHVVAAMLRGETADFRVEGKTRKVRFLNPENGALNVTDPVRLHLSAFGPRGRELTARLADGWINFTGSPERAARQFAEIEGACREAGRDPASLQTTVFSLGAVLEDGEAIDCPRAIAEAGPGAAVSWHGMVEALGVEGLSPEMRRVYESYSPADARYLSLHRGHLLFVRDDERQFVTPELLRQATMVGSRAELRDRMRAFAAAGYDQLTIQLVYGHEDAIEHWAEVIATV